MARILDELYSIAAAQGYDGTKPESIAGAIDALADTLAGSDVDSGQTVAQAVRALAPYIGSGGGGSLGALQLWPLLDSEITESAKVVFPLLSEGTQGGESRQRRCRRRLPQCIV